MRKETKIVKIRNIYIGGHEKIAIQSMTNTNTADVFATVSQILALKEAGCDIVRLAIPDFDAVNALYKIKEQTDMPIVGDIHFDYRLALECIAAGADKIRINPGNIGGREKIRAVVNACRLKNIPIRIGVNGGSLEKEILEKYKSPCAEAMADSAFYHIGLLNSFDFDDIVVSIKSSSVKETVKAYRIMRQRCNYPLHVGVTEAGLPKMGIIKSAIAIGSLLLDNIGDTIRVSLTADPVKEVFAAKDILKACGLKSDSVEIISCPTCGRCKIDLIKIATEAQDKLSFIKVPLKVAIMGCAVNGPGEAREADIGIAGGDDCAVLFKKGRMIRKIEGENILDELVSEIKRMVNQK